MIKKQSLETQVIIFLAKFVVKETISTLYNDYNVSIICYE